MEENKLSDAGKLLTGAATAPSTAVAAAARRRQAWMMGAVVGLVFLGWQLLDTRYNVHGVQESVIRQAAEIQGLSRDLRQATQGDAAVVQTLQTRVAALEVERQQMQEQKTALEKLYQDFSASRDEHGLQEVEQAIAIAAQQLQLAANVPAAIQALQAADTRLAGLNQARVQPLRKQLTADLDKLKALARIDVAQVSLQLETLLGQLDKLPLAFEHKPQVPASVVPKTKTTKADSKTAKVQEPTTTGVTSGESTLYQMWQEFWVDMRQLIRVERLDHVDDALLAPSQVMYLREQLRLRLLSARLALLQRDGRVFAEDVAQARQTLARYFDTSSPAVAQAMSELQQRESLRLSLVMPSLADSEAALRRLRGR